MREVASIDRMAGLEYLSSTDRSKHSISEGGFYEKE
jgi:hypothetical protein